MRRTTTVSILAGAALMLAAGCSEQPTTLADADAGAAQALAAGEAGSGAMRHGGPRGMRGMRGGDPLQGLLRMRTELGLSDDQAARIEEIRARLLALNAPLMAQVREIMGREGPTREELAAMTPEERRARMQALREARRQQLAAMTAEERQALRADREAKMEAAKPILEQIRANGQTAMESAKAVLTAEQRALVQQKMEARRERMREQGEHGRRGARGAGRTG